jgi:hypothetical protein
LAGKSKYLKKTCPSATLFATGPILPDLSSNLVRRGGKPTTNRMSSGTARKQRYFNVVKPVLSGTCVTRQLSETKILHFVFQRGTFPLSHTEKWRGGQFVYSPDVVKSALENTFFSLSLNCDAELSDKCLLTIGET